MILDTTCPLWNGSKGKPLIVNSAYCNGVADYQCRGCGWNPSVHDERVRQLREMAAQGRLKEWGKPKTIKEESKNV